MLKRSAIAVMLAAAIVGLAAVAWAGGANSRDLGAGPMMRDRDPASGHGGMMGSGGADHGYWGQGSWDHLAGSMGNMRPGGPAPAKEDWWEEQASEPTMMPGHTMTVVGSESDYLAQMIPHHEEAIASARVLLERTDRPEMKTFAEKIIDTQSAEVAEMLEWLADWHPGQQTSVDYVPMMRDLTGLTGGELDRVFLEDMIGHHMAAVMMSQQLLAGDLAEHQEVVPFAEQIRDDQHAEIFQMSNWLADWAEESATGSVRMCH